MTQAQVHVINLPRSIDRRRLVTRELAVQGVKHVAYWNGVEQADPIVGISRAHKQIVSFARQNNLPSVLIAEDDIQFTSHGAFQYFLGNEPHLYDLYLGAISYGRIDEFNQVIDFSGLLFYRVHQRFYDKFLNTPEHVNLDRALRGKGLYCVCPNFIVLERSGISDKDGQYRESQWLFTGRPLFKRASVKINKLP